MEVCGGQTHSIIKSGLDQMLPPGITDLIHGPGCPVCVTPLNMVDKAHRPGIDAECDLHILRRHAGASPASTRDLFAVKAAGGRRAHCLLAVGCPGK